jgi:hypothetical protein
LIQYCVLNDGLLYRVNKVGCFFVATDRTGIAQINVMAITHLHLTLEHDDNAIMAELRISGINGKGQNEIFHTLDALRIWKDWLESRFGSLINIDHHSNPDDPPDVQLHFEKRDVSLEHTELKPHPYGMVDAIHHHECPDQCITVPSLSNKPKTRSEITNAMFAFNEDAWADWATENEEWLGELKSLVDRKVRKHEPGILLVQDTALLMPSDVKHLAVNFQREMQTQATSGLDRCTILLHSRLNSVQYASFLFKKGETLQERIKLK